MMGGERDGLNVSGDQLVGDMCASVWSSNYVLTHACILTSVHSLDSHNGQPTYRKSSQQELIHLVQGDITVWSRLRG